MIKKVFAVAISAVMAASLAVPAFAEEGSVFPLAETATLTGMISYPSGTEEDQNKKTIRTTVPFLSALRKLPMFILSGQPFSPISGATRSHSTWQISIL